MYGPAVDVFSFAIVMSELATLNERYTELRKNGGSESWQSIQARVAEGKLRPLLPDEFDPNLRALIEACWHQDPRERPSALAVLLRLENVAQVHEERQNPGNVDKLVGESNALT